MAWKVDRSARLRRIARRNASTASRRDRAIIDPQARQSCKSGTVRAIPSALATRADTRLAKGWDIPSSLALSGVLSSS
jgi:hypothetical protein